MATSAVLGESEADEALKQGCTEITAADIYRRHSRLKVITGANSLLNTAPLARQIELMITMETLDRVAREHDKGRRLVIGTTNLDFAQLWYWSLSEMATQRSEEALELYRKLLLAAASPTTQQVAPWLRDVVGRMRTKASR